MCDLEKLFSRALAVPADARPAWLTARCGGDAHLHRRLSALLRAHEAGTSFMEAVLPDLAALPAAANSPAAAKAGDRIGRYTLRRKLGEGGCGVVYLAGVEDPDRRPVALKLPRPGTDAAFVGAQFAAEHRALAHLTHPFIARGLETGTTLAGHPYLVMERARGIRLTEYCDRHRLGLPARLAVFIKVCRAIQHAHERGVIHCDLKPSNILVCRRGGEAVPKVIDFGIARTFGDRKTTTSWLPSGISFSGTPAYVSPEQAAGNGGELDARSDLYSLGVILYELVTGRTPFGRDELTAAGGQELRRRLREELPPPPSRRFRRLDAFDRRVVARRRDTTARGLDRALGGDLDRIILRCLEKDPERRFESAAALADEVQRHFHPYPSQMDRGAPGSAGFPPAPWLRGKHPGKPGEVNQGRREACAKPDHAGAGVATGLAVVADPPPPAHSGQSSAA